MYVRRMVCSTVEDCPFEKYPIVEVDVLPRNYSSLVRDMDTWYLDNSFGLLEVYTIPLLTTFVFLRAYGKQN